MSQSGVYSELKPVWWYAREGKLPDAPKQIQLILSDECNMSCGFCAYRMDENNPYGAGKKYTSNELFADGVELSKYGTNNPKRHMPTSRALSLIDEIKAAGVIGIQFTGGGEVTVHADHEEIFQHALDIGMKCSMVSNGLRWSDSLIYMLSWFSWVRVSVDAGDAETFSKTRRTPIGSFKKVWGNIARLALEIKQNRASQCVLGVGYVVTPENYGGILSACRMAKEAGAHNIRMSAMFSNEDERPFVPIYNEIVASIRAAQSELNDDTFTVADNFGSRVEELRHGKPDYDFCSYMWYTSYIGADLNNYVCCVYSYSKRGLMTNLSDRRFDEWWASDERKDFMNRFKASSCERCQFDMKNRQWLYVAGDNPSHVEWT